MNQSDPSARTEPEAIVSADGTLAKSGRKVISKVAPHLRRGVESGAVSATIGGVGIYNGLQALVVGKQKNGLAKLALGAGFLTAALVQQRSRNRRRERDVVETDVGDTGVDVDAITDDAGDADDADDAASEAAVEMDDTGVESEDLAERVEREMGEAVGEEGTTDERMAEEHTDVGVDTEAEEVERLGEAAFDRQSREVPAPQQAFNRGFLAHSSMVNWGIRERDGAVLIAQDYDTVEGRDGVKYVASSEIGTDVREVPIPDAVLDHWDEVFGGGTAVTGGDDILFVTTESLAADKLLRVLPAEWADGLSE